MSTRSRAQSRSISESSLVRAIRDEPAVVGAYAARASFFSFERAPVGLRSWRLFPQKDGGFIVGYSFHFAGESREGARSNGGLYDIYAEIDPARGHAASDHETAIDELEQIAWRLPCDPRFDDLDRAIGGDLVRQFDELFVEAGRILAYRPRVRATLRFDDVSNSTMWLRLSASKNRFARVLATARVGAELRNAQRSAPFFPRILAEFPEHNGVLIEHVPGIAMHSCLERLTEADIESVARAIVEMSHTDCAGLNAQHGLDEAEQTSWTLRRAARLLPGSFHPLEDDLAMLFDTASDLGTPSVSVIHRDLHDKQVIFSTGNDRAVTFLDSDTLAAGDSAFDVANLAAHLELRELQGALPPARGARLAAALVAACARRGLSPTAHRLAFFQACAFLRLAGVYALRSNTSTVVEALLARGRAALSRLQTNH